MSDVSDGAELSVGVFSFSSFGIAPALRGSCRGSPCCWNGWGGCQSQQRSQCTAAPVCVTGEGGMWADTSGVRV